MKHRFLLLLLLLCLLPFGAHAAARLETLYLSASASEGTALPQDSTAWYKGKGGTYYLLMPGGTDWNEVRLWYTGSAASITVNGTELHSGDRCPGLSDGSVLKVKAGKKTYTVAIRQGSAIGALFIGTQSGGLSYIHKSRDNREAGSLLLLAPDGSIGYNGDLEHIKIRGNTSTTLAKKNYGFKLAQSTDLLGLGKAKRWVLLGSYRDHSQLRNQIVYQMASYIGLRYTPDTIQVDVYLNHEYNGTYLLTEKIEVGKNRVDIDDLEKANKAVNDQPLTSYPAVGSRSAKKGQYRAYRLAGDPADITGGYIIEYENFQARFSTEPCAYTTDRGKVLLIKSPSIVSIAEMEYISSFMQGYENAIFAEDGRDPVSGRRYDEFVDFNSLVLKYMLEEISMNCDGNASSQYYVKPSDEESTVAFAGPAWDYDTTFGDFATKKKADLLDPTLLIHSKVASRYWWPQLYRKPEFLHGVKQTWSERCRKAMEILLGTASDPLGRLLSVDEYAAALEKSAEMNFIRWPMPKLNSGALNIARTGYTYRDNVTYLKDFIARRYAFLDSVWSTVD